MQCNSSTFGIFTALPRNLFSSFLTAMSLSFFENAKNVYMDHGTFNVNFCPCMLNQSNFLFNMDALHFSFLDGPVGIKPACSRAQEVSASRPIIWRAVKNPCEDGSVLPTCSQRSKGLRTIWPWGLWEKSTRVQVCGRTPEKQPAWRLHFFHASVLIFS